MADDDITYYEGAFLQLRERLIRVLGVPTVNRLIDRAATEIGHTYPAVSSLQYEDDELKLDGVRTALASESPTWMKDGLIDLAVPMNYASETDARVRGWFDGWIRWEKRHTHGRQLAVGIGAYRNTPDHILDQISRVRRADGDHRADGLSFFSYASPQQPAEGTNNETSGTTLAFLAEGIGQAPAPFARPAPVPAMPWIDHPQTGWIAGVVRGPGAPADTVRVKIKRTGFALFRRAKHVDTDGNGYFGLTNVKPGRYRVWIEEENASAESVEVIVEAGKVSRADLRWPNTAR